MSAKLKKIICVCASFLFLMGSSVSASTISEIQAQQDQLQAEKEQLESELASLQGDQANAEAYQATLVEKIELTKKRIDAAIESINVLNESIKVLEARIDSTALEYKDTIEQLQTRLKELYLFGDAGTLEFLLDSTSLYDYSLRSTTMEAVAEHDRQLMDELQEYLNLTQADRDALALEKEQVAELKKQLETDQEELNVLMEENAALIVELENLQADVSGQISSIEEEDASLNAEIERLIEEQRQREEAAAQAAADAAANAGQTTPPSTSGDGSPMSDGFSPAWPVPGSYYISWTYTPSAGHYGLDIADDYGTPIVAVQSGEVLDAFYHSSWGNNVLIYHNSTYSTRYAHLSSMAVSAGQYVERNQVIGYMGNTGYSFGNHLHFEVYQNGTRVDPQLFL